MSEPIRMADLIWHQGESLLDQLERLASENHAAADIYTAAVDALAEATSAQIVRFVIHDGDTETFAIASPRLGIGPSEDSFTIDTHASSVWVQPNQLNVALPQDRFADSLPPSVLGVSLRFDSAPATQDTQAIEELSRAVLAIASRVHQKTQLHRLGTQVDQSLAERRWLQSLHSGTNLRESFAAVAAAIATQTGADRVSLLQANRKGYRLIATSAASDIDRRAAQVRSLEQLVTDSLTNSDEIEFAASDAPSPISQRYVTASGCQVIRIGSVKANDETSPTVAAIVLENFRDANAPIKITDRTLIDDAIRLAHQRDQTSLTQITWSSIANRLNDLSASRKFVGFTVASLLAVAFLCLVPAPLDISATGRLVAVKSQRLFAPTDAITDEILVTNGQRVTAGEPLIRLRSAKLDLLIEQIQGDLATAQTELAVTQASRSSANRPNNPAATPSPASTEQLLQTRMDGLRKQRQIVQQQIDSLTIRSPIDGQIDRWDLDQTLQRRPVAHGEFLLAVISPDDGWQVQLEIPESDSGYVIAAQQKSPVNCTFRLTSDSQQTYSASLIHLSDTTQINDDGRPVLRGKMDFTPDADVRTGSTVQATIDCGNRAIGFVWFRSVIQWARQQSWL